MTRNRILLGAAGAAILALLLTALLLRGHRSAGEPAAGGVQEGTLSGPAPEGAASGPLAGGEGTSTGGEAAAAGAAAEEAATPAVTAPVSGAGGAAFSGEQNRREVTLFFQESSSDALGPERRKIFLTASSADQAKQIVQELINGPQDKELLATLPAQTRLRGLYFDRAGTAYVDLSDDLVALHPGGSDEEIATIFSIVDSLTYNLPEIKRVHFLINGEERDTLKAHLDLRRDYRQDLSIVDMDRRQGG